MRRIVIIGSPGSGKTTLAKRLSESLGLPCLELDSLFHPPVGARDWDTFRKAARAFTRRHEGWIVDGNYVATRKMLMREADTVIWLDMPLTTRMLSLLLRTLGRLWRSEPLLNGNPRRAQDLRSLDPRRSPAVRSVTRQRKDRRTFQKVVERPRKPKREQRVVRLMSRADVELWVRGLDAGEGAGSPGLQARSFG